MTTFFVPGRPIPKARPRLSRRGHVYTPRGTSAWEADVGWTAKAAGVQPIEGEVSIDLEFNLPDRKRVDLDNLIKAVLDGLNGVAWGDDDQVCEIHATKRIDQNWPGVQVCVR